MWLLPFFSRLASFFLTPSCKLSLPYFLFHWLPRKLTKKNHHRSRLAFGVRTLWYDDDLLRFVKLRFIFWIISRFSKGIEKTSNCICTCNVARALFKKDRILSSKEFKIERLFWLEFNDCIGHWSLSYLLEPVFCQMPKNWQRHNVTNQICSRVIHSSVTYL